MCAQGVASCFVPPLEEPRSLAASFAAAVRWAAGSQDFSTLAPKPATGQYAAGLSRVSCTLSPFALLPQTYYFLHLSTLNCIVRMLAESPGSPPSPSEPGCVVPWSLLHLRFWPACPSRLALPPSRCPCDEVPVTLGRPADHQRHPRASPFPGAGF